MSTAPSPSVPLDAVLGTIVDDLLTAHRQGTLPPCLIHLSDPDDEGFDLGIKPLDGDHPSVHLLGFVAPTDWHALGSVTSGWARDPRDPTAPRRRVCVATLRSRSDESASAIWLEDATDDETEALRSEPDGGEQVDFVRRALRLPTPPPPAPASVLLAVDWLQAILDDGVRDPAAAIARHPAVQTARDHELPIEPHRALVVYHRVHTWARLREMVADDQLTMPELVASDANWFDDGSFARFVLVRLPPLGLLRARVRLECGDAVGDAIDELLDRTDVPRMVWPEGVA